MNLHRRSMFVMLFSVAACTGSTSTGMQQAVTDAQIVVDGVSATYLNLKALYPTAVSANTDAQVQILLARLPVELEQLKAAVASTDQASDLRSIERDINGIINLAAGIISSLPPGLVPPAVVLGFQAAVVLLPIIEASANRLVPSTVGAPVPPRVFVSRMGVDEARTTLVTVGRAKR